MQAGGGEPNSTFRRGWLRAEEGTQSTFSIPPPLSLAARSISRPTLNSAGRGRGGEGGGGH